MTTIGVTRTPRPIEGFDRVMPRSELLAASAEDEIESEEAEDDPADDHPRDGVIDAVQEQPSDDDAGDGGRQV